MYGYKIWIIIAQIKKKLLSFENKILRLICGTIRDEMD